MPTARYRILFDLGVLGEFAGTKIDIEYDQNASAAQLTQGMDAIWDWWTTGVSGGTAARADFSTTVSLAKVTGQQILPTLGAVASDDRADTPGTRAAAALPPQCSVVASFRTAVSERRQRGRMYLPPTAEVDVDAAGVLDLTQATALRDRVVELATELESAARVVLPNTDANHVIVSTRAGNPPPGPPFFPATTFEVTTYLVGRRIDSQRKRLGTEQSYV